MNIVDPPNGVSKKKHRCSQTQLRSKIFIFHFNRGSSYIIIMPKQEIRTQEIGPNGTTKTTTHTTINQESGAVREVAIKTSRPAAGGPRNVDIQVTKYNIK
jgi:hypothetical protein